MIEVLNIFATPIISSNSVQNLPQPGTTGVIHTVLSVAFGVIGAFALLMITVSGLRYVLSAGDPGKIKQARNGIIYSLVGLVIAISAEAVVHFVVAQS